MLLSLLCGLEHSPKHETREQQALGQWPGETGWCRERKQAGQSMPETEPDTPPSVARKCLCKVFP